MSSPSTPTNTSDVLSNLTLPPLTMPRLLGWAAQQYGDKTAIREAGENTSYRQLNDLRRQAGGPF